MSCGTSTAPICPCGTVAFPQVIYNPPGLRTIAYRPGEYVGFRHALLRALPGETELTQIVNGQLAQLWRPGAEGDLAVQMVEWWAYLCDVLTFYNERIANQAYLGTADLPESINRLIQILGYRPRPALGARGTLAALLTGTKPLTLAKGFQVQSKPGPGQQPQTFELDADTTVQKPDVVSAQTQPASQPALPASGHSVSATSWLWLAGKVSGVKRGEKLLLVKSEALAGQTTTDFAWLSVSGTAPQTDPTGKPVTQISYKPLLDNLASNAQAADYVLLRSAQALPPWSYTTTSAVIAPGQPGTIELAGLARGLAPGDLILLEVTGTPTGQAPATTPAIVQAYSEQVWYANGDGPTPPVESPPGSIPAVSIPHSHVTVGSLPQADWNANAALVTARWNWTSVGQLVPALTASDLAFPGTGTSLIAPATTPPGGPSAVLLEDANGNAASADAAIDAGGTITLTNVSSLTQGGFAPPIDVFFDLLPVSRGKTVANEILGSGNPQVPGQDFTLQQSPVTYQQDPASISGDNYSSTVAVSVNGVRWSEVRSFYGQDRNAQIFLTREDEQGRTHVVFGDGVNGARLPTGVNNVVASYRYGAGAQAPAPQTLTVILHPQPGLKSLGNPIPPTGGADADPPSRIRALAPRSVMTFDRAVSLDDYQAIAAGAPGVMQAKAEYVFDPLAQRPRVTLWVAGDAGIVAAVQAALATAADPNRPVVIIVARPVEAVIGLTYIRDPRYADAAIQAGITAALLDPDNGLLGTNIVGIGQVFYDSQIYAACRQVPGVTAVHNLSFSAGSAMQPVHHAKLMLVSYAQRFRIDRAVCTGQQHDPGAGNYFSVPNDGQHLHLSGAVAS